MYVDILYINKDPRVYRFQSDWSVWLVGFTMFNATFNNISVITWWPVLLVEEITDLSQVTDKLYHIMLYT